MAKEPNLLSGNCPNCGGKLEFEEKAKYVTCYFCDSSISVATLLAGAGNPVTAEPDAVSALIANIDNPESGLIYLDNFVDTYDWASYALTSEILIYSLEKMVEKTKIKSASSPLTWYLDFESARIAITKKVESLKDTAAKMAEKYSNIDNTKMMSLFDTYKAIVNKLINSKDALTKRLQSALKYCEKLGLEAPKLAKAKKDLDIIVNLLNSLTPVTSPNDIAEVKQAKEKIDKEKAEEFLQKGIDVVSIYNEAVAKMDSGEFDRKELADQFFLTMGYSESSECLKKINKYFKISNGDENLYIIGGKKYAFNWVNNRGVSNTTPTKKKGCSGSAPAEENKEKIRAPRYIEIYEVTESGVIDEKPLIKGVTQMIGVWGNNIYYIKDNHKVCSFNVINKEETVLDRAKKPYPTKKFFWNETAQEIYFFKKLDIKKEEEKKGCSLFAKKESEAEKLAKEEKTKNNYSIVGIDLKNNTFKTIVDQVVDVFDHEKETILYTVAERKEKEVSETVGKKTVTKTKAYYTTCLMLVNTSTGEKEKILSENCDVQKIINDKVIYTIHTPNDFNKDLRVYTISTKEDVLIEKNILDYVTLLNDKIYYLIGNDHCSPLFSNNLEGTERTEILPHLENNDSLRTRGNWLYIPKGTGVNAVLVKISADGKTIVRLCSQFSTTVKITDSHVYYLDYYMRLHVVRTDGKEDKIIATGISKNNDSTDNIIINEDKIYYLRREPVGIGYDYYFNENDFLLQEREKLVFSNSLYSMDLDGHNVQKIAFDVEKIKDYDEEKIYFVKKENARFEVKIPTGREQYKISYTSSMLTHFVEYEKATEQANTVLTFGLPESKEYEVKKGCMGKEKVKATYTKLPPKSTYKRKGLTKMGETSALQTAQTKAQQVLGSLFKTDKLKTRTTRTRTPRESNPRANAMVAGVIIALAIISSSVGLFMWLGNGGTFARIMCFVIGVGALAISGALLFLFKGNSGNEAVPILKKCVAFALAIVFVLGTVFGFISCSKSDSCSCGSGSNTSFQNAKSLSLTDEDGKEVAFGAACPRYYKITIEEDGYYSFYSDLPSYSNYATTATLYNKESIDDAIDELEDEIDFDEVEDDSNEKLSKAERKAYISMSAMTTGNYKKSASGEPNFSFRVKLYEGDEYYLVLEVDSGKYEEDYDASYDIPLCFVES